MPTVTSPSTARGTTWWTHSTRGTVGKLRGKPRVAGMDGGAQCDYQSEKPYRGFRGYLKFKQVMGVVTDNLENVDTNCLDICKREQHSRTWRAAGTAGHRRWLQRGEKGGRTGRTHSARHCPDGFCTLGALQCRVASDVCRRAVAWLAAAIPMKILASR